MTEAPASQGLYSKALGDVVFVYAVAPHHPLAQAREPLSDEVLQGHRAVAVADTVSRGQGLSFGLLGGQDVFTVATMRDKLEAQLRGLGSGYVPQSLARPFIETGRLVVRTTARPPRKVRINYAWRQAARGTPGRALAWWLADAALQATLIGRPTNTSLSVTTSAPAGGGAGH